MPSRERPATHTEASASVSFTIFRLILNLDKRLVFFDRVFSPTVFWVRLGGLDFSEGAPVTRLVTAGDALAYDATGKVQPATMFDFVPGTEATLGGRRDLGGAAPAGGH